MHVGIVELGRLIESQEADAKKKLANNAARMQLAKKTNEIQMWLQGTERIDINPEGREADLQVAIDAFKETKPYIREMRRVAGSILLKGNEEAEQILNFANEQQSAFGQKTALLLQSLLDRKQVLTQFTE